MFPSEAYRELCIENRPVLWPIWDQRAGDFFVTAHGFVRTVPSPYDYAEDKDYWMREGHYNWLPRLDQLIEMLEERGYHWRVSRPAPIKPKCSVVRWATEDPDEIGKIVTGPDPATALLKAYLEVVKEGTR